MIADIQVLPSKMEQQLDSQTSSLARDPQIVHIES
jgi:hypothetical protein